jgi:peptidoglycan hydrolase-like protein with peptidoglycan-binding domain
MRNGYRRLGHVLAVATLTAGVGAAVALPASPAQASHGACTTKAASAIGGGGMIYVPYRSSAATTHCSVREGARGEQVKAIQWALIYCYANYHLVPDGAFGPITKQALIGAQAYERISADGVYGPITRSHLQFPRVEVLGEIPGPGSGCYRYPA